MLKGENLNAFHLRNKVKMSTLTTSLLRCMKLVKQNNRKLTNEMKVIEIGEKGKVSLFTHNRNMF